MSFDPLRTVCARLPGATKDIKWGADEVYSVGGKMFAVFWIDAGHARTVSFKCDPERFLELTDVPGIVPAPYLARAHWVQVREASALPRVQAEALLADSHARVLAGLTRKLQAEIAGTPPKAAATQPKTRSGASAPKLPTRKKPR
jgi:predicted DNA-binding protein (MmcQ/YjbR family)